MLCSVTGVLCVLLAAGLLGMGLGREERQYLESLRCALELLHHIRREVDLFSTPCDALFRDAKAPDGLPVTDEKLQHLCVQLRSEGQILRSFLDALGSGYREDTLRLCDDTAARLQNRLEKAEKEYPSRVKLYTAMPLLIAVSVIVLIL